MTVSYNIITERNNYYLDVKALDEDHLIKVELTSIDSAIDSLTGIDKLSFNVKPATDERGRNSIRIPLGYQEGNTSKLHVIVSGVPAITFAGDPPVYRPIELDTEEDTGGGATPSALGF